jgi:hypothetical protein
MLKLTLTIPQKGGKHNEQRQKSGGKKASVEKVLLATAIIQLIHAVVDLINKLLE